MRPEHFLEAQGLAGIDDYAVFEGRVSLDLLYLLHESRDASSALLARVLAATSTAQDTARRLELVKRYAAYGRFARPYFEQVASGLVAQPAPCCDLTDTAYFVVNYICQELEAVYGLSEPFPLAHRTMLEALLRLSEDPSLDPATVALPYPISAHPDDPHWTGIP